MHKTIVHATLFLLVATASKASSHQCLCLPGQSCWPTADIWNSFNISIRGALTALKPIAAPCHDPTYDERACAVLQVDTSNSTYRSDQPATKQWENWEAWPQANQQCYVESPRNVPCGQGRVSAYSAEVEVAADIQAAVGFAAKHNIKLVIKNSGHDFLGRSSAPASLQISTHKMRNITVLEKFVPSIPLNTVIPSAVKAVRLEAGVPAHEMYEYLGTKKLMAFGGSSGTVGPAGGYIQGGGHGIMGWIAGMASDNALEFQIVTADSSLLIANEYQNTDLFWALRGGGGGTWGVVVSVTVKAYPDYPVIFVLANYTLPGPDTKFWNGVEASHHYFSSLNDQGGTGYYRITPISPLDNGTNVATYRIFMWFVNQTDTEIVATLFSPLLAALQNATGTTPFFHAFAYPTLSLMYATIFGGPDNDGNLVQLGSRLISRDFVDSPTGPAKIMSALSSIKIGPEDYFQGHMVSGGQVAANAHIDSAINPAWRKTLVHMLFTRLWSGNTTFEQQAVIAANITDVEVPILKSFEPGQMGAYTSEADANEPDFQQSFWGPNYPRLYAIKAARDPRGLFIVRKGVGSEDWDDAGLCRLASAL